MELEVIIPSPAPDFSFDSASTSPFITAPSSPSFYRAAAAPSAVPFGWEEHSGMPKTNAPSSAASSNYGDAEDELDDGGMNFAFGFSVQLDREPLPADELFDGGRIKPLDPPPRLQRNRPENPPPRTPRSPGKFIREAFSAKSPSRDFDPFAAAMEKTRREGSEQSADERKSGRAKKSSVSLSPFRVSDMLFEPDPVHEPDKCPPRGFTAFCRRRWRIKDLLLFRSASEGRAKQDDVIKNSSFRSTKSVGPSSCRRRSGPAVSAHELHYTVKRQLSEEMRKKTFLPYKQGLLGCLGLHTAAQNQFLATGIVGPTGRG